jgi:hypothetical protein
MSITIRKFVPSGAELIGLIFLDILVLVVGNSKQLLSYYGLSASNQVVQGSAGSAISTGLSKLDNYSLTAAAVTFAIWAGVGLLCFSFVRGIADFYQKVELDKQLTSKRYIQPAAFKKATFWKGVFWDFGVLVAISVITLAVIYLLLSVFLPTGIADSRLFTSGISAKSIIKVVTGLAILYVGLVLLDFCVRLLAHRRQFDRA